jgi:hypothetical protein
MTYILRLNRLKRSFSHPSSVFMQISSKEGKKQLIQEGKIYRQGILVNYSFLP